MIESMLARIGKILLVFAMVTMIGANWAILQTVAWTTMLANNLRTESLSLAVSRTFDGEHPCPLCRAITEGKNSESKTPFAPQRQKLEFPPLTGQIVLIAPSPTPIVGPESSVVKAVVHEPLLPPPRSFFI